MIYNKCKWPMHAIVVLLVGTLLLSGQLGAGVIHVEDGVMVFKIIASQNTVCAGASLPLEIEFRNISKRALGVRMGSISSVYSSTTRPGRNGEFPEHAYHYDLFHAAPAGMATDLVMLTPGSSHRRSILLPLADSFYRTDGIYRLSLSYSGDLQAKRGAGGKVSNLLKGTLDSNEIIFEIRDCN